MKLDDCLFLADENIDPEVIAFLRARNLDVASIVERRLVGTADADLLRLAVAESRVVITHDSDFGELAVAAGQPVHGILYLRPGHIDARFVIELLETVLQSAPDVAPPFIFIAHRRAESVSMRVRSLQR